eukprot:gene6520-9377_t
MASWRFDVSFSDKNNFEASTSPSAESTHSPSHANPEIFVQSIPVHVASVSSSLSSPSFEMPSTTNFSELCSNQGVTLQNNYSPTSAPMPVKGGETAQESSQQILGDRQHVHLQSAVKTTRICALPSVLKFHVKRFCWEGSARNKLQHHVVLPLTLDMSAFCTSDCVVRADTIFNESMYDLAAVITHEGFNLNSGHYKCYCNTQGSSYLSDRWILANDSRMNHVSLTEVLQAQVYVAFYVHRSTTEYVRDSFHVYPDTPIALND